jgi:hypothetical protein
MALKSAQEKLVDSASAFTGVSEVEGTVFMVDVRVVAAEVRAATVEFKEFDPMVAGT